MYHTTQPGGHYGALIGNIGGMGDIASGFNNDLSYPYIPGRDVQGVPNANDPIMREKLRQRLLKNPGEGPELPGFVKKAEAPFGANTFLTQVLPEEQQDMNSFKSLLNQLEVSQPRHKDELLKGLPLMDNASFFYGPQYGQNAQQLPIGFGGISVS